jgi:2-keto-myo-inositol isomerase
MKLCFNQATTMKHSSLEKDLMYCEKYGYDFIEIRIDKLKEYLTRHSAEELAGYFKKSKIKPFAFNGLEEFSYRAPDAFKETTEDLKLVCSLSDMLDCKMVTMDPGSVPERFMCDKIEHDTVLVINELLETAKPYGMKFAFEFCGSPDCSVNTYGQAYKLIEAVNNENVGIVLDLFHFWAMGSQLHDLEKSDVNKIFMVHIDDSESYPTGTATDADRVWPGEGAIDTVRIMKALVDLGYDGVFSLELFRPEYWEMDIEQCIKTGKEKSDLMLKKYYR